MGKYKNTLQKGSVRYVVFKDGASWYAAGLEFNIVESGTTPHEALLLLFEALRGYVETAKEVGMRPQVLNQKVDKEYESLWKGGAEGKSVFATGELNLMRIPALA
jgi:hypothetical protein